MQEQLYSVTITDIYRAAWYVRALGSATDIPIKSPIPQPDDEDKRLTYQLDPDRLSPAQREALTNFFTRALKTTRRDVEQTILKRGFPITADGATVSEVAPVAEG